MPTPTTFSGTAFVYDRDDIDTDIIIPARYLNTSDATELAKFVMEPMGNEKLRAAANPIVISGKNFGCGSSREHAVWALAGAGVKVVIADSFARIFFRNSINFGLVPVILPDARKKIADGDEIEIDTKSSVVKNLTKKKEYAFEPLPEFLREIAAAGGLLNTLKK